MATETGALGQSSIRDVLNVAADKTQRYVREVVARRVSPSKEAVEALAKLHEPFPTFSSRPREVIASLDQIGSAATVPNRGGHYFGFGKGERVTVALAAVRLVPPRHQH